MLRTVIFVFLWAFCAGVPAVAQKFGYVDTEFIYSRMPEYKQAQAEIDKFADRWSKDILDKYAEIDRMQRAYQAEEVLLTDAMKQERQQAIAAREREAREYNNKVFGYEGLLFQKKKELMKVPSDLLNQALEKIAAQKKLDFVFDKASEGATLLYTNPRHDYTDYVVEELGLDKAAAQAAPAKQPK